LTVAEELRSSGKELLLSIVIGYELMNRITVGTPAEAGKDGLLAGFRNSTVFGIFGATAAAAKLAKLSQEQFGDEKTDGCNDYLVISYPDAVEQVPRSFLEAGVLVLETNTYRSNRIALTE